MKIEFLTGLFILIILISGCLGSAQKKSSPDKVCLEAGTNKFFLEAIEKKYPQSEIIRVYEDFTLSMGPHWDLEIKTKDNKIVFETISRCYFFSLEQCNENVKEGRCFTVSGPNCDQENELAHCQTAVAFFYEDADICKVINDTHKKNNCFALIAGLNPPYNWDPSICEKLSDEEARLGCIQFFEEDEDNS